MRRLTWRERERESRGEPWRFRNILTFCRVKRRMRPTDDCASAVSTAAAAAILLLIVIPFPSEQPTAVELSGQPAEDDYLFWLQLRERDKLPPLPLQPASEHTQPRGATGHLQSRARVAAATDDTVDQGQRRTIRGHENVRGDAVPTKPPTAVPTRSRRPSSTKPAQPAQPPQASSSGGPPVAAASSSHEKEPRAKRQRRKPPTSTPSVATPASSSQPPTPQSSTPSLASTTPREPAEAPDTPPATCGTSIRHAPTPTQLPTTQESMHPADPVRLSTVSMQPADPVRLSTVSMQPAGPQLVRLAPVASPVGLQQPAPT